MYELPFFAPKDTLPSPLPPPEVIASAGVVLEKSTGRRVVQFGDSYIIKYGIHVSLTEGKTLLFLNETQTVPVPKVFALYSRDDVKGRKVNYIIMEKIPGQSLDACWALLEPSDKEKIARQLRTHFNMLRNIPAPGYFGCLDSQPFEESIFWVSPKDKLDQRWQINGPFKSEAELNTALVQKYLYNNGSAHKATFLRRMLPSVLKDHVAVFTHGDLQRKNVMIKSDNSIVLIDWEAAGWYPEYWEYASATVAAGAWKDDWHEYLSKVLNEYPNEYSWFDMFIRDLWS
ncbi:phosphotransferase enzyme family [Cordyceps militaris]|uniref:Phosphotransferase enzyme family n=1 Tax=Cordyceps militaris TaxID=73501 RepID=A0A2H4STA6_CORMI|nr:phosphotransferase enzyme family [Cordyceps militaris]